MSPLAIDGGLPLGVVTGITEAGTLTALLTFPAKLCLGWPSTRDPMLLGIVRTAATYFLRRWLDEGPGKLRHGFTAASRAPWISEFYETTKDFR